jgi:cytochrome c-type biogenesis protein CcmE
MKPKYLIGALAALALIIVAVYTVESKKIEYMDFPKASTTGSKAQIAGTWVKDKGCTYDPDLNQFTFTMKDEAGNMMPVVLDGAKPNNFEIAVTVVATGRVDAGTFRASHVLTKCPSKYESGPPTVSSDGGASDAGTRMN